MSTKIEWKCTHCGKVLLPNHGWITISGPQISVAYTLMAWDKDPANHGRMMTLAEIMETIPDQGKWVAECRSCADMDDGAGYDIEVGRIATENDVIRWTIHLLGKNWLPYTNWGDFLHRNVAGGSIRF